MQDPIEIRWIKTGIVAGILASILYPALLVLPGPSVSVTAAAGFLGLSIGIGSLGLMKLITLAGPSVSATIGAVANFTAGALFTGMALVQLAVKQVGIENSLALQRDLEGVWLGLDVAWDVYIGVGTVFLAWAVSSHPRFRWVYAAPGLLLGAGLLILNLAAFPQPPASMGWIDLGPFVGLWYLAATLRSWRSLPWARDQVAGTA